MLLLLKKIAFTYTMPARLCGEIVRQKRDFTHHYKLRSYDTFQMVEEVIREKIEEKDPEPSSVDTVLRDITFGFYAIPNKKRRKGFYIPGLVNMQMKKVYGYDTWGFLPFSIFTPRYEPLISGDYTSWDYSYYLNEECDGERSELYKKLPDLILYVRRAAELRALFMLDRGYV